MKKFIRSKVNWKSISLIIVTILFLVFIYKIFISGSRFVDSLAIKLFPLEKDINLRNDNIYTSDIVDILDDISEEVTLPEDIYISGDFKLLFKSDGTITNIDALLYGKNDENVTNSFSLTYDSDESKQLKVIQKNNINIKCDEKYSIIPLIKGLRVIPLKYTISNYESDNFEIIYSGKKECPVNTTGIVYINPQGKIKEIDNPLPSKINDYTISILPSNKNEDSQGFKYIFTDNINDENITNLIKSDLSTTTKRNSKVLDDGSIEFKLNDNITYTLKYEGTADVKLNHDITCNTKKYSLYKFNNENKESILVNDDVFPNSLIENVNLTFIDENLGFISASFPELMIPGKLFRTEDGGKTFENIYLSSLSIETPISLDYSKLTLIDIPYEDNGNLYMKFNYGYFNSYKGHVLCKSDNKGKRWSIVKGIPNDLS